MRQRLWLLIPALLIAAGCKPRASSVSISSTRPSEPQVRVTVAQPPATAPATRPAVCTMTINGNTVEFPRARLVLVQKSPTVVVRLFSNDPKDAALDRNYMGNSFYFEIPLDVSDPLLIPGMQCTFTGSAEHVDTASGIFLEGTRKHLQPFAVTIRFDQAGADTAMELTGQFMLFRAQEGAAPESVFVRGVLTAELETK